MARIDLVSSGFIYSTKFESVGTEWILSPSGDYFAMTPEGLRMDPSSSPNASVLALLSCKGLNYQYAVEAKLKYLPSSVDDSAGLALWSSDDDAIYLSLVSGTDRVYDRLRFCVKDERCEAYAYSSDTDEWEVVGTAFLSKDPLPAVYAEGGSSVVVEEVVVTRDIAISIGNVPNGYTVLLTDEEGAVIATGTSIDGSVKIGLGQSVSLALRGCISIYDGEGVLVASTGVIEIFGGDMFWYNTLDLKLLSDGVEIKAGDEVFLGGLINGVIEKRLEIYNPTDSAAANVTVCAANFNVAHGDEWVSFAPDINGVPGYYDKTAYIPQIEARGYAAFWVKIQRPQDMLFYPSTDHRFSIVILTS